MPVSSINIYWLSKRHLPPFLVVFAVVSYVAQLSGTLIRLGEDSALYLYSGASLAAGRPTYKYVWDVKPPGIHNTVAVVSALSSGDRQLTLLVMGGVMILMAAAIVWLVGLTVYELTNSDALAFVGSVVVFAYPKFTPLLLLGPNVKYFATAFGVASMYSYLSGRERAGIGLAAVAAAYWQLMIVFLLVLIGDRIRAVVVEEADARILRLDMVMVVVIATVLSAPFLAAGAFLQMIEQTVIAPFITGQNYWWTEPIFAWLRLGPMNLILLIAFLGYFLEPRPKLKNEFIQSSNTFVLYSVFFGLALILGLTGQLGATDLLPLTSVAAIVGGYSIHRKNKQIKYIGKTKLVNSKLFEPGTVLALGLVGFLWGLFDPVIAEVFSRLTITEPLLSSAISQLSTTPLDWSNGPVAELFRSGELIDKCHIRLSFREQNWIQQFSVNRNVSQCSTQILSERR